MKRFLCRAAISAMVMIGAGVLCQPDSAQATPSTTYWTPATSDIQPYGVWHLGIDNYFSVAKKKNNGALPTDVGLTVGVLPYEKIQMEAGVDYLEPTGSPLFFNAKAGTPEGALFKDAPAFNIGIFNVGTHRKNDGETRTDYDIVHLMAGKTLPYSLGRVHVGLYYGNGKALVNRNGKADNKGFMIGWDKGISTVKDSSGAEYSKWVFAADYASGKNYIGGGGVGVYRYFTKDISLLAGPVWFNDAAMAGPNANVRVVATTQLDINF